jgi:hypothetical protein
MLQLALLQGLLALVKRRFGAEQAGLASVRCRCMRT